MRMYLCAIIKFPQEFNMLAYVLTTAIVYFIKSRIQKLKQKRKEKVNVQHVRMYVCMLLQSRTESEEP